MHKFFIDSEQTGASHRNEIEYAIENSQTIELNPDDDMKKDQTILKLQEVNEKFRQRVLELENIVQQTVSQFEKKESIEKQNKFYSHRFPEFEDQRLNQRNVQLKEMQTQINTQKKNIQQLKIQIESLGNLQKVADIDNQIQDVERQNKEKQKLQKILEGVNKDQKEALELLVKNTEYENQEQHLRKEINKWKEKHKMLTQYKKEEEINFKVKFELLVQVEETRARLKEAINNVKYGIIDIKDVELDGRKNNSRSVLIQSKRMQRSGSQPQIDNERKIVQQGISLNKVVDSQNKRYLYLKVQNQKKEQALQEEVDQLKLQIFNVEKMNTIVLDELKQLMEIQKAQRAQSKHSLFQDNSSQDQQSAFKRQIMKGTNSKSQAYLHNKNVNAKRQSLESGQSNYIQPSQNNYKQSQQDMTYRTVDSVNDRVSSQQLDRLQEQQSDLGSEHFQQDTIKYSYDNTSKQQKSKQQYKNGNKKY